MTTLVSGFPSPARWQLATWGVVGLMVLIPTFAAVALYLAGIKRLGAPQAALVSTLELPFTILLAAALVGERLSPIQWVGAAVVLGGVVMAEWGVSHVEIEAAPAT